MQGLGAGNAPSESGRVRKGGLAAPSSPWQFTSHRLSYFNSRTLKIPFLNLSSSGCLTMVSRGSQICEPLRFP
jgi:hypothetical protein